MGEPDFALHEQWRKRVADAKLRLEFARIYLAEIQRDFTAGSAPSPDGRFAYQKALHAEQVALAEYMRVLRLLTVFVVEGKVPEEGERPKSQLDRERERQ